MANYLEIPEAHVSQVYKKFTNWFSIKPVETGDNIKDISIKGLPVLPLPGEQVEKDKLYNYDGKAVHCIKAHCRTLDCPDDKPGLFITQTAEPIPL